MLDGLLCARAALGRTGSWSFPIDDAYIYANYVRAAGAGHPFAYNFDSAPGELSGGVTGAGWLGLLWAAYPLTGLLGTAPAGLAPAAVRAADPGRALAAGRLYLAAYGLGALLLAGAALATGWLAWECTCRLGATPAALAALAAGGALLVDQAAIWGTYSGLEIPLSLLLLPLALAPLLHEVGRPPANLRWSLLGAALLPWARPELAIVGGAALGWLAARAARGWVAWRVVGAYAAAVGGGLAALVGLFWAATGRPLPSSFYAKVGGLHPDKATAALQEWLRTGAWQPFALAALAVLGAAAIVLALREQAAGSGQRAAGSSKGSGITSPLPNSAPSTQHATRPTAHGPLPAGLSIVGLPLGAAATYAGALLLTLPWFGQQDRYIVPIHTLALPLAAGLVAAGVARPGSAALLRRARAAGGWAGVGVVGGLAVVVLSLHVYAARIWAASDYALFVQNIEEAHVGPALWLAAHAPPGVAVAAEPIGAVRLFGGHPTVDLVGLTTPAQLGHYGDWPATAALLAARGAQYLLYYPRWWPSGRPLAWAHEVQRFPVPDNRIAGDDPIAVYQVTVGR